MEIVRVPRNIPAKSRSRNERITLEKPLCPVNIRKEPVTNAKLILEYENIDIEDMTVKLEEAGDTLANDPTLYNFLRFKDSLGNFARKVTSIAYCIDKICTPWQRPHVVTRIVDEGADYLYTTTMNGQHQNILIAGEIDDIKGMILSNCI